MKLKHNGTIIKSFQRSYHILEEIHGQYKDNHLCCDLETANMYAGISVKMGFGELYFACQLINYWPCLARLIKCRMLQVLLKEIQNNWEYKSAQWKFDKDSTSPKLKYVTLSYHNWLFSKEYQAIMNIAKVLLGTWYCHTCVY